MSKAATADLVRPPHPCTRHHAGCPPPEVPPRSLGRRLLRGVIILGVLILIAWVAGVLFEASHVPDFTRYAFGGVGATTFVVIGLFRLRTRRR